MMISWVALLISPEFEGIKTNADRQTLPGSPLLISPEFEGIKTQPALFHAAC